MISIMKGLASLAVAVLLAVAVGVATLVATGSTRSEHLRSVAGRDPVIPRGSGVLSAAAFARTVLAEAPVPTGSEPISSVPSVLDQAIEHPGIRGLIDLHRSYSSPDSPEEFEANVLVHLPAGATRTGTGTFGGPSGSGSDFIVSLPTSGPNEYLAQLVYSMVASGNASIVRVDAQCVWEPDRTAAETIPRGATAELTGYAALSLARPSSGPIAVRLDANASARLTGVLNRLPVAPPPNCMEDALLYTITFRSSDGAEDTVIGDECAATVEISVSGQGLASLHDVGCSVLRLVRNDLPRRATGTRRAASQCTTSTWGCGRPFRVARSRIRTLVQVRSISESDR